jgi:hypothetical protein
MSNGLRTPFLATIVILGLLGPLDARGDIVVTGSFGPNGDVGFVTSPPTLSISFGPDGNGAVSQMDGFVNVPGQNYGGISGFGTSGDLANGPPTGLSYTFSSSQPTADQLLLSYTFVNNSGAALPGFQFLHFVDPDTANFNTDVATVTGGLGLPGATSYQVGDPALSTIFTNLAFGTLSNTNDFPPSSSGGDVSIGLGFSSGTLGVGQSITFDILLSDDGSSIGGLAITDSNPGSPDTLTVSGAVVPEPSALISMAVGTLLSAGYLLKRRVQGQA